MSDQLPSTQAKDSTDTLLWLGALVVAGVGISWLVLTRPWTSDPAPVTRSPATSQTVTRPSDLNRDPAASRDAGTALNNPLRMAHLALDAGMLVEPDDYSAWSLFERVLADEPGHAEALDGLDAVSEILVERGSAALEQGRVDDAQAIVDRILSLLPQQTEAARLATEIDAFRSRAAEQRAAEAARLALAEARAVENPEIIAEPADVALAEPVQVDPLIEMEASFESAIANNELLTPLDGSAKYFLELMTTTAAGDSRALDARDQLFDAFILRAGTATRTGDVQSAQTWIDEAAALDVNESAVADAQNSLTGRLIEMESLKRLPASSFEISHYEPPVYPTRARQRNIEGWVDVEFVVTLDGETRDVRIAESSHDSFFRQEAQNAVEAWRFEPRVFLGEPIEQQAFTRVRFALQ